ncbi:MAG: TolC family protein, partial [Candidatus Desantisbacteria bacterium]
MNKLLVLILLQTSLISGLDLSTSIKLALENNLDLQSERLSLSKEEISLNKAKKEEFYEGIEARITQGTTKETIWMSNEEGVEEKMVTKTEDKPAIEIDSILSRPHPLGGKLKINLKTTTGLESSQNKWEVKLESEEPISSWQRKRQKDPMKNERLQLDLAKLTLRDRIEETIFQVIESYCELQNLEVSSRIKEKELKDLQDNLETSKLKAGKGIIPEMDIIQIELQVSSVLNEIETLKKDEGIKLARFSQQIGTQAIKVKEILKDEIEKAMTYPFDLEDLNKLQQIKRKRIEIEQAEIGLNEARSKNALLFIPSYSIGGEKKQREEKFGISLSLVLYDKGIKKEEIRLAEANLSQAEIELK